MGCALGASPVNDLSSFGLRRRPASSFGWQLEESVGQTVEIHVSDKEQNNKNTLRMGRLFKPWRIVGASITESELSDSISNILHHFMVAHSQSKNTIRYAH